MSDQSTFDATENATTAAASPSPDWGDLGRRAATAVVLTLVLTVGTGLLYPLVTGGFAQVLFPIQANGSLVVGQSGAAIGSALIGQQFTDPRYFHPRPSAAGNKGYDATSSGGSNLGPTNATLIKTAQDRAVAYRQENGLSVTERLPADAVTASASGLDPDISPANALLQVHRVAVARGLTDANVRTLVERHTEGRTLGILGEPRVNVLALNLALDEASRH